MAKLYEHFKFAVLDEAIKEYASQANTDVARKAALWEITHRVRENGEPVRMPDPSARVKKDESHLRRDWALTTAQAVALYKAAKTEFNRPTRPTAMPFLWAVYENQRSAWRKDFHERTRGVSALRGEFRDCCFKHLTISETTLRNTIEKAVSSASTYGSSGRLHCILDRAIYYAQKLNKATAVLPHAEFAELLEISSIRCANETAQALLQVRIETLAVLLKKKGLVEKKAKTRKTKTPAL